MADKDVESTFCKLRWPETNGNPVCPYCGSLDAYEVRRPNGSLRFRCPTKGCRKDFTVTSGTLFASHKKPLRVYLLAIVLYANEVKGKNALALSRDLGTSYKAAFVLLHKLREAMADEVKATEPGKNHAVAEVDGAAFGGYCRYVKPANLREDRKDRRLKSNQSGKRKFVVIVRERGGNTLPAVFKSEHQAIAWIKRKVAPGTVLHADEAPAWNDLHAGFEVKRINHQEAYSLDGACTNQTELFFSRIRRGEVGHYHGIAGP
jgi:transposase-like protein